jgi:hypothetical protein
MTNVSIFDQAISAHAQWKRRLNEAIDSGSSEWTVSEVRADDRCEFGKWLNTLCDLEKSSDSCLHLRSLHTEFHHAASEVLELALAGKKDDARAAMSPGNRFNQTSTELVLTLGEWRRSEGQ